MSTLQTFSVSPPDINFKCTTSGNLEEQTITCTTSTPINSTKCAYDGGPAEACTLPVTVSYSQFSAGNHTLVITVTDSYGQTGTTKFDFTISETIPGQLIINTLNIFSVYCLLNVCNNMLCIRNTFKINIICISLPDLTVSCVQGAVSGRTTLQCSTSNNITSTTCSIDGQPAQPCSLPLQLLFSEYGPSNHTVLLTFTDEFVQTLSTLQTFSVSPPDINFKCTTSVNLEEQTISCTTSTPINSTTCAYDGGLAEACTLPVTVSYSQFSAGRPHTSDHCD